MKTSTTSQLGQLGERIAANYLKRKGYAIIEMNYSNRYGKRLGEIDIIAKEQNEWIFVEVKTRQRQSGTLTIPEENITYLKIRRLEKITSHYVARHGLYEARYRFDAISVWIDYSSRVAKVKHIKNIY